MIEERLKRIDVAIEIKQGEVDRAKKALEEEQKEMEDFKKYKAIVSNSGKSKKSCWWYECGLCYVEPCERVTALKTSKLFTP